MGNHDFPGLTGDQISALISDYAQPLDADLTAIAGLSTLGFVERTGAGVMTARALEAADIPNLSAVYQPLDSDLTAIAALSPSDGTFIRRTSGAWVAAAIVSADLTTALTTPPTIGGTTPGVATFSRVWGIGTSSVTFPVFRLRRPSNPQYLDVIWGDLGLGNETRLNYETRLSFESKTLDAATNNANVGVMFTNTGASFGGHFSPSAPLDARKADSATNSGSLVENLGHNSSATVADGFGGYVDLTLENAGGTTDRLTGRLRWLWNDATNMIADVVLSAVYNHSTEREGIRIRGGSSATQIAFFGGTPVARPSLGTWAGLTTDQKLDALRDALAGASGLNLVTYA